MTNSNVKNLRVGDDNLVKAATVDTLAGTLTFPADIFLSTAPLDELVDMLDEKILLAENLHYRDRVTVGLLVDKFNASTPAQTVYIADSTVKLARLQIFNNLSESFVADKSSTWLGADYFCGTGDDLNMSDDDFIKLATDELAALGLIDAAAVKFGACVKVSKALLVPENFDDLRGSLDAIKNLKRLG